MDVLQWLFRSEPLEDAIRLPKLREQSEEIDHCFRELIRKGLIGCVGTFPYSVPFGKEVSSGISSNTGWISYHNILETENSKNLPRGQWMIGLRPLAAGKVFEVLNYREDDLLNSLIPGTDLSRREKQIGLALSYCCGFEEVKTNVLSINSMEQAKELKKIIDKMPPVSKEQLVLLEASDGR
jgi:hypothetical protein